MTAVLETLGAILLVTGGIFAVIGGIGLIRLPDFYTRIHGAGITDTMGAGLILTGLMLIAGPTLVTVKLVMILALLWTTGPTATHALAKAALASGLDPEEGPAAEPGEEQR